MSNGVYVVTSQILVGDLILKSYNNGELDRDGTIIDGNYPNSTNRCVYLNHADAVVEGFTISNAYNIATLNQAWRGGGGAYLNAGTLRGCLVTGNVTTNAYEGGGAGIYAQGANSLITDCDIMDNLSFDRGGGAMVVNAAQMWNCRVINNEARGNMGGGVVLVSGAAGLPMLCNSVIVSNGATGSGTYGGGLGMRESSIVRNCLIMGNSSTTSRGGGIGTWGGGADCMVENCTVVSNIGRGIYKGWWTRPTYFRNNIVYYNTVGQFADTSGGYYAFTNCCIDQTGLIGSGNTDEDPAVADLYGGDYRLTHASPCLNTGTNFAWMDDALDLDGNKRLDTFHRVVDMGCYEYFYQGTTVTVR